MSRRRRDLGRNTGIGGRGKEKEGKVFAGGGPKIRPNIRTSVLTVANPSRVDGKVIREGQEDEI